VFLNYRDQIRLQKKKMNLGFTLWTASSIYKKYRDSLTKSPAEPVTSNPGGISKIRRLTITTGGDGGEKPLAASEHGSAMAGARDTSLPGIIQQIESTGRKSEARRPHLT
jgi:hypothetical protein